MIMGILRENNVGGVLLGVNTRPRINYKKLEIHKVKTVVSEMILIRITFTSDTKNKYMGL